MACMYSLPRTYLIFMYAIQFFHFIYLFILHFKKYVFVVLFVSVFSIFLSL